LCGRSSDLMFEEVIATMLKHKQLVFAAIAVTALAGMISQPIVTVAQPADGNDIAQGVLDAVFGNGEDEVETEETEEAEEGVAASEGGQAIGQEADQTNEQDADAEQEVDQDNDQSETNVQANELDTGDNTATVTQANAAEQEVAAAADAAAAAEAESEAEVEDEDGSYSHHKDKKHGYSGSSDSDSNIASSVADAEAIANAAAEATGIQNQDNTATVTQDSSIHDVDLSNNVQFGDDTNEQVAIPIIDQDQRAANLAEQRAANLDLEEEIDVYGITVTGTP